MAGLPLPSACTGTYGDPRAVLNKAYIYRYGKLMLPTIRYQTKTTCYASVGSYRIHHHAPLCMMLARQHHAETIALKNKEPPARRHPMSP